MTIKRTAIVSKPLSQVFDYLADFRNAVEWDSGTVACTRRSGDGGVGTTYANTSKFLGRKTDLTYVVETLEPPHRLVLRGENATVVGRDTLVLTSADGSTRVDYTAAFDFKGAVRFLQPLLRLPLEKLGNDSQKTLLGALSRL
ncbi:MAG: SRPBCC family protein [Nocardioidaceae bacterium]|nr:SRPBCC family protein [Nocardioidaceae bacterium]